MHIFHLQMSEVCFLCRDPVPAGKSQREQVEMPASIASASLSKNFHRCRNMHRLPYYKEATLEKVLGSDEDSALLLLEFLYLYTCLSMLETKI